MTRKRTSRGGGGRKVRRYWDGLQLPTTQLSDTVVVGILLDGASFEQHGCTIQRIVGSMDVWNQSGSTRYTAATKICYVDQNDAGNVVEDVDPFDTHEEDIARRQLWQSYDRLNLNNTSVGAASHVRHQLDARGKVRIPGDGKRAVAIFMRSSAANSDVNITFNIRILVIL